MHNNFKHNDIRSYFVVQKLSKKHLTSIANKYYAVELLVLCILYEKFMMGCQI